MKARSGSFKTVTVTHSWPVAKPDGSTAILLQTEEAGCIAFRVDRKAVALLRKQLSDCEALLLQQSKATMQ